MVKTGIIRRFDDLGRIAVPKEVRKQVFGKTDLASVPMEFFYEKDGTIIMKPVKETDMNWLIYVKKKGRDCMSNRPSYYRNDEIKYKIDTAIQMKKKEKGKENWDTLLEVQDKLYDEFGLSIE